MSKELTEEQGYLIANEVKAKAYLLLVYTKTGSLQRKVVKALIVADVGAGALAEDLYGQIPGEYANSSIDTALDRLTARNILIQSEGGKYTFNLNNHTWR